MMGGGARGHRALVPWNRSLTLLSKRERHRWFYSDAAAKPWRPFKAPP
jgi:hypothetical protein